MKFITDFTKSDAYRAKIHRLIPGGAHTYSKGDDQFPILSPAAIDRGEGAYLWDLDGNRFLDCSMGLTSVSLGHAYGPVIERIKTELTRGVNFQRPSKLELEMAEAFLGIVPQHDMIKFAKNGSSATTAAVKLARAYTKRTKVAFPSDHPFYSYDDWFISKTACNRGVPEAIANLSVTYDSMNLASLKQVLEANRGEIACVLTEPDRYTGQPSETYLRDLQKLCQEHGVVLVFDEMVCGFKTDFPGAIKKYGVTPDLATWGKGIANGFSFCALTGKRDIMELGGIQNEGEDKLFLISTTHGGETTALAAGLATIDEFKRHDVVGHNQRIGRALITQTRTAIKNAGLEKHVEVYGCPWQVIYTFKNNQGEYCNGQRTLFLQEMIKRGVLFQGMLMPCFSHTQADVDFFTEAFAESLTVYAQGLELGWQQLLKGPPTKPVFRKKI